MKVVVFGATGLAGRHVVEQALAAGHEVIAVARKASSVALKHPMLKVIEADLTQADSVARAIAGGEAVISTIGPRKGEAPGTLISGTTERILAGMKANGIRRFVLTSGYMVGQARGIGMFGKMAIAFFRRINHALYLDKLLAERLTRDSGLDWVIVRPPNFDERAGKGKWRMGVDLDVKLVTMSAADVAGALLEVATQPGHVKKEIEISD